MYGILHNLCNHKNYAMDFNKVSTKRAEMWSITYISHYTVILRFQGVFSMWMYMYMYFSWLVFWACKKYIYIRTCTWKIECKKYTYVRSYVYEEFKCAVPKKEQGANPEELFQAFGPNQQGAAQSLPGCWALYVRVYMCMCVVHV